MALEIDELRQWIGRTRQEQDRVSRGPLAALCAMLDRDPETATALTSLPPLWHWLFFQSPAPQAELAADGHPRRGGFLPPVPLPRRMWAGGRVTFLDEVPIDTPLVRTSTVSSIELKQGRSGPLAFVQVHHDITAGGRSVIREEHDIVYRDRPSAAVVSVANQKHLAPADAAFERTLTAGITMLFRYSALTFNAHRIHYDRDYAVAEEGYPGLVVHGPLLATLLVELWQDNFPGCRLDQFGFRALQPVFDGQLFRICGSLVDSGHCRLWVADRDGRLCMDASAAFTVAPGN